MRTEPAALCLHLYVLPVWWRTPRWVDFLTPSSLIAQGAKYKLDGVDEELPEP